ncbi:MAG: hypothetical protein AAF581_05290 [Planctomycetota bacterium]
MLATAQEVGRNRQQSGAALILAILMMTALVSFGVVYLEVSSGMASGRELEIDRVRAVALAEAGIAHAHSALLDDPLFTGPLDESLGDGGYQVTIRSVPGAVEVSSVGGNPSIAAGYKSMISQRTLPNLRGPFLVGNDVHINSSTIGWGGSLGYGNALNRSLSIALGLSEQVSGDQAAGFNIDFGAAQSAATTSIDVIAGDIDQINADTGQFQDGTYTGITYVNANLDVMGDVTLEGTLIVDGNLTIHDGAKVSIQRGDHPTVLIVGGNLTLQQLSHLTMAGTVYVRGNTSFNHVSWFEGQGSLVTNGDLTFQNCAGGWEFDPNANRSDAFAVNGPPTTVTFTEIARVPYAAAPTPDLGSGSNSRGSVTSTSTPSGDSGGSLLDALMSAFGGSK